MSIKKYIPQTTKRKLRAWKETIEWFSLNTIFSSFPSQTIRTAFLRLMGADISKTAVVYGGNEYRYPKGLKIGAGSAVGHRAILDSRMGLTIGENVAFGTEVMIWTLHHDYNDINFKGVGAPVVIGDHVWLCSRCIIMPGVIVGKGAVVAAGAVVTKDVEPYSVVGGIPAKKISQREVKDYDYSPSYFRMHMV